MKNLRELIRRIVLKELKKPLEEEELLTEPDEAEGREETEASSGGVAGVAVPLGAGPNHPLPTRRKNIRSPQDAAAAAFGGSKIKKNKK